MRALDRTSDGNRVALRRRPYSKAVAFALAAVAILALPYNASAASEGRRIESMIRAARARAPFSGSILVAERGRIVYSGNFGYADLARREPVRSSTAFELASVSKPITALAVLMLQERGRLSVDDPIAKYLPEVPYSGVTLRHLLTHTSGLPDPEQLFRDDWPADRVATDADVVARLALLKPEPYFAPGTRWRYNTTSYFLLARIVEKVSGVPFAEFLRENVFRPAGMRDASVAGDPSSPSPKNLAIGYMPAAVWSDGLVPAERIPRYRYVVAFGDTAGPKGIRASARDLFAFVRALGAGVLVNKETLEAAYTPVTLADGSTPTAGGGAGNGVPSHYGFGWFVEDGPSGRSARHTGDWPGYITCLIHDLGRDRTVVVLSNTGDPAAVGIANAIEAILDGRPYVLPPMSIARTIGKILVTRGVEAAVRTYHELKRTRPDDYDFGDENALNGLGYALLGGGKSHEAVEVFRLNVEAFPGSWNVHDSLGEAYAAVGDRVAAIASYRTSVELNPGNRSGIEALKRLGVE